VTLRWLLALVLALVLAVGAGCGGDDNDVAEPVQPDDEPAAQELETVQNGVLTVGSDIPFPPFEFRENGELTGYDVEMIEEMAERLGLETNWVATDFDTIFTQLAAGRFDVVASATTITEEREQQVNFTDPYYRAQQALIVNAQQSPDIESVDDIGDGHVVAVQRGTTGESWARENLEPQGAEIRSFPQAPDTYTALEVGNVTAVVFDEPSGVEEAQTRDNLEVVDTMDTGEEYGFGVNPANERLLEEMNRVLAEMLEDGTYAEIYQRWFPDAPAGSVAEGDE
jgi:polar amino acid transport system substrate-binding protein